MEPVLEGDLLLGRRVAARGEGERRLLRRAGVPLGLLEALLEDLADARRRGEHAQHLAGELSALRAAHAAPTETAALRPQNIEQLVWLGLSRETIERLRPFVTLLPQPSAVNLNTAPREVIAAVLDGLDLGSADRLVQLRQRDPFKTLAAALGARDASLSTARPRYMTPLSSSAS